MFASAATFDAHYTLDDDTAYVDTQRKLPGLDDLRFCPD